MRRTGTAVLILIAGCHRPPPERDAALPASAELSYVVKDTVITATFDATGIAEPIRRATLSTKLMGSVTQVLVHAGDRVAQGAVLARIDARDVEAKGAQADAGITAAEAGYNDALVQAERIRALYADSAATRYQLDQAETGLARAQSGLRAARASRAELDAVGAYAVVRAPFSGLVTMRHVDPGAFIAPGAPLIDLQDVARLRISVSIPPATAAGLRRGERLSAEIEGQGVMAVIEGVVPSGTGTVYTVNAVLDNPGNRLPVGGSATLHVPAGTRRAVFIPSGAVVREGDLAGVRVRSPGGTSIRWVTLGAETGGAVEVLSGLHGGDVVLAGTQ